VAFAQLVGPPAGRPERRCQRSGGRKSEHVVMPGLGAQDGGWVDFDSASPSPSDHLDLQLVADGRHSIPTAITVSTSSGSRRVTLPHIGTGKVAPGSVTPVLAQSPPSPVRTSVSRSDATDSRPLPRLRSRQGEHRARRPRRSRHPRRRRPDHAGADPHPLLVRLLQVDGKPIDIEISGPPPRLCPTEPVDHPAAATLRRASD